MNWLDSPAFQPACMLLGVGCFWVMWCISEAKFRIIEQAILDRMDRLIERQSTKEKADPLQPLEPACASAHDGADKGR